MNEEELKDYRLTTLAKQQTGVSKYALNLEHKLSWYDDQLTKAKELLERLLITSCNSDVLNLLPNCSEVLRVRVEAEQFLKDETETETEQEEPYYVIMNMNCQYEICRKCPKSGLFKGTYEECKNWIREKLREV